MNYKKIVVLGIVACVFLILFSSSALANNLAIANFGSSEIDTTNDTLTFTFDIAWENSWRNDENYDAAWVFMKYYYSSEYHHATMAATGTNPTGFVAPQGSEIVVPPDGMGFFIQRHAKGTGDNDFDTAKFVWDYGTDGLSDANVQTAATTFKIYGIEMVYIPQGGFYAGDGTSSSVTGQFEDATSGDPFYVDSEDMITLGGGGAGSLGNNNASGMTTADDFDDGTSKTLPATFPKGYNAFYMMKYEISQGQYRDFLNTLTLDQQDTRTADDLANNNAAAHYIMSGNNDSNVAYRNGLYVAANPGVGIPYVVSCDVDDGGDPNQTDDGEWIACNYLSWADTAAYMDWSALRPFTELEFEKACRGPLTPGANEYAWGTTGITQAEGAVQNPGEASEVANTTGDGLCNYNGAGTDISGPLRVGFAAASSTNRVSAGAGYYGVMELGGNLYERPVTVGNSAGRDFTGIHGNGELNSTGDADTSSWPETDATGAGLRGGNWYNDASGVRVSCRDNAASTDNRRGVNFGGRGVRVAP